MDLGAHAGFIWAAYGAAAVVLAGVAIWLAIDGRRQAKLIDELEARGVRRQSRRGRLAPANERED